MNIDKFSFRNGYYCTFIIPLVSIRHVKLDDAKISVDHSVSFQFIHEQIFQQHFASAMFFETLKEETLQKTQNPKVTLFFSQQMLLQRFQNLDLMDFQFFQNWSYSSEWNLSKHQINQKKKMHVIYFWTLL